MNIFMPRGLAPEDRQLVRYILGLLPQKDAERLDEQSIVDDELATRLRSVENDLVDAYVCGTLDGEFLERFESFYLASPRRRDKVKFAREFLKAVDRLPKPATVATSVHVAGAGGGPAPGVRSPSSSGHSAAARATRRTAGRRSPRRARTRAVP